MWRGILNKLFAKSRDDSAHDYAQGDCWPLHAIDTLMRVRANALHEWDGEPPLCLQTVHFTTGDKR